MHGFVCHNGNVVPLEQVRLSPGQAGLLSGWGLFTTLRLYDGQPFAFERHWQRFTRDAARVHMPFAFSAERVLSDLLALVGANRVQNGAARVFFVYNRFGLWHSEESLPLVDVLIYTTDLPVHTGAVHLGLQSHGRHAANPLTGTKVTSWLQNVWSLERSRERGFEEVILLNERGEVAECTATNLFCVRGGRVETPALSAGCLAGVTREVLLELGRELSLPIEECSLTPENLYQAEEVFITSTTRELQPVALIEDNRISQAPGPMTACLARVFSEYVASYFARRALHPAI